MTRKRAKELLKLYHPDAGNRHYGMISKGIVQTAIRALKHETAKLCECGVIIRVTAKRCGICYHKHRQQLKPRLAYGQG